MTFDWRTDWKRPVLWGASFGVAAVLTLFVIFEVINWYSSRPKKWDTDAVKGISTTVSQIFTFDNNQMKGAGFSASFIVENSTSRDFIVQNLQFYKREVKSQALEEVKLTLDHQFVIRAHERSEVTASMDYSCSASDLVTGVTSEREGKECFQDALGGVSEFVAFDNGSHIRLNLPKPVFYEGKEPTPKAANSGVAPDHAAPWDKYWACSEARRLTPICKREKIELGEAQAVAGGWTLAGPLPTLPRPPKGLTLDPTASTCKIAYQWDSYCERKSMPKQDKWAKYAVPTSKYPPKSAPLSER
jgi:hypothetical protein